MIKKFDLYIIKKFLGTFAFIIIMFVFIIIVFDVSEKIDDFINKKAPLNLIITQYYLNFIPSFLSSFGPLFAFLSVVFFTSKLALKTEVIAFLSNGISFNRFLRPYLISSIFLCLLNIYLNNFVIPKANYGKLEFENKYIKNIYRNNKRNIHSQIEPGKFVYFSNFDNLNYVGYNFSLEKFDGQKLKYKLISDVIRWDTAKQTWNIVNYYTREIKDNKEIIKTGYSLDTVINNLNIGDFTKRETTVETLNFFELRDFIKNEKLKGSEGIAYYEIEFYKRFSFPIATILLTLIGLSISNRKIRGGLGIHLTIGIILGFFYILLIQISTTFALYSSLSPFISVWIPNVIYLFISIFMLRFAQK